MNQSSAAVPDIPVKDSKPWWRLVIESYVTFIIAVSVAAIVGTGFGVFLEVRSYWELNYLVSGGPSDESELERWGLSRPHVLSFQAERRGDELWVRSEYVGFVQQPDPSFDLAPQLRSLGYVIREVGGGRMGVLTTVTDVFQSPVFLATSFGSLQLVLVVVGLLGMRKARTRLPDQQPVSVDRRRAFKVGLLTGVVLLAVGFVHDQILQWILGSSPPSLWNDIQGLPRVALFILIGFGAIGAPVSEEIFFRGYIFGKFQLAGLPWTGFAVSSLLFGAAHFSDPWHIPGIVLFGVILAWTYQRTGTLLAPMTAHAVNNLTGLLLLAFSS